MMYLAKMRPPFILFMALVTFMVLFGGPLAARADAQTNEFVKAVPLNAPAITRAAYLVSGSSPAISTDGRWVVYKANSLNYYQTYVLDRTSPTLPIKVSKRTDGVNDCGSSNTKGLAISGDGRYVAFVSDGRMAPEVTSCSQYHGYVHDRDIDQNGIYDEINQVRTLRVTNPAYCSDVIDMAISGNGRFVSYGCYGTGGLYLTDRDGNQNGIYDEAGDLVFYPRLAGSIWSPSPLDALGKYAAFRGKDIQPTNLFCQGTSGLVDCPDIHLYNLTTQISQTVSTNSVGVPSDGDSRYPALSPNGLVVAFYSGAATLVENDLNVHTFDVFVKNLLTGEVIRASAGVNDTGDAITSRGYLAGLSESGRYVVFSSTSPNLVVPPDSYSTEDVFLFDTQTSILTRLSSDWQFTDAYNPSVSGDGRYVVYDTYNQGVYLADVGEGNPAAEFAIYDPNQPYDFSSYTFHTRVSLAPNTVEPECSRIILSLPADFSACMLDMSGLAFGSGYDCLSIAGDIPPEWTACHTPRTAANGELQLLKPYTLTVTYLQSDVSGAEANLAFYYYENSQWIKEPTSQVNIDTNTLTATPQHWGIWQILAGEPLNLRIYLPLVVR